MTAPASILVLLSAIAVTGLLITGATYQSGWQAGVAISLGPYMLACAVLVLPIALRKSRTILASIRGLQWIPFTLFLSCILADFFPDVANRSSEALKDTPTNSVNVARIVLVGLVGLVTVILAFRKIRTLDALKRGPLRWILLYAAVTVMSVTYASVPLISAGKALEVFVDVLALIVIASLLSAEEIARSWNIIWFFFTIQLTLVWISAICMPSAGFEFQAGAAFPLLQGAFPTVHPNRLGQFGATLAIVALGKLLRSRPKATWETGLLWSAVFFLGMASMIGAQARTALSAFLVAFVISLYLYRKTKVIMFVALIGIAGVAGGLHVPLAEFLRRGQNAEQWSTLSGRMAYWIEAWNYFKQSTAFGHGFYTAHRIDLNTHSKMQVRALDIATVDNTYLEVLLGVGLIGTVPLVLAVLALARSILCWAKNLGFSDSLANTRKEMIGFVTIVLIRSFTGPTFQTHSENLILVLIVMAFVHASRYSCQAVFAVSRDQSHGVSGHVLAETLYTNDRLLQIR